MIINSDIIYIYRYIIRRASLIEHILLLFSFAICDHNIHGQRYSVSIVIISYRLLYYVTNSWVRVG